MQQRRGGGVEVDAADIGGAGQQAHILAQHHLLHAPRQPLGDLLAHGRKRQRPTLDTPVDGDDVKAERSDQGMSRSLLNAGERRLG